MNSFRSYKRLLFFGTSITSAFFLGTYVEQKRQLNNEAYNRANFAQRYHTTEGNFSQKLTPKPGLPIFGTVSAAVPVPATPEVKLTATPSRVSEIMRFGFPGMESVRSYSDFVLSYDRRNRVPHWVFEHITPESVAKNDAVDRAKCDFRPDESIHPFFRSENSDYRRSGFDRGHMAAAANHRLHQKHCEDTFYLTNMAPQVGQGFNRDSWNRLEMYVRKLTQKYPNVYVCTGPLYLPNKEADGKIYVKYQVIGNNTVAVPTHFYKIIVGETADKQLEMESYVMPNKEADGKIYVKYQVIGNNTVAVPTHFYKIIVGETADKQLEMESYVMPNKVISDETPLEVFRVPPESVERAAGLLFFDGINRKQLAKINGKKV